MAKPYHTSTVERSPDGGLQLTSGKTNTIFLDGFLPNILGVPGGQ